MTSFTSCAILTEGKERLQRSSPHNTRVLVKWIIFNDLSRATCKKCIIEVKRFISSGFSSNSQMFSWTLSVSLSISNTRNSLDGEKSFYELPNLKNCCYLYNIWANHVSRGVNMKVSKWLLPGKRVGGRKFSFIQQ